MVVFESTPKGRGGGDNLLCAVCIDVFLASLDTFRPTLIFFFLQRGKSKHIVILLATMSLFFGWGTGSVPLEAAPKVATAGADGAAGATTTEFVFVDAPSVPPFAAPQLPAPPPHDGNALMAARDELATVERERDQLLARVAAVQEQLTETQGHLAVARQGQTAAEARAAAAEAAATATAAEVTRLRDGVARSAQKAAATEALAATSAAMEREVAELRAVVAAKDAALGEGNARAAALELAPRQAAAEVEQTAAAHRQAMEASTAQLATAHARLAAETEARCTAERAMEAERAAYRTARQEVGTLQARLEAMQVAARGDAAAAAVAGRRPAVAVGDAPPLCASCGTVGHEPCPQCPQWPCPKCTFLNDPCPTVEGLRFCAMCNTPQQL